MMEAVTWFLTWASIYTASLIVLGNPKRASEVNGFLHAVYILARLHVTGPWNPYPIIMSASYFAVEIVLGLCGGARDKVTGKDTSLSMMFHGLICCGAMCFTLVTGRWSTARALLALELSTPWMHLGTWLNNAGHTFLAKICLGIFALAFFMMRVAWYSFYFVPMLFYQGEHPVGLLAATTFAVLQLHWWRKIWTLLGRV